MTNNNKAANVLSFIQHFFSVTFADVHVKTIYANSNSRCTKAHTHTHTHIPEPKLVSAANGL